jgi:zona occludens toxin (predicted ATPase)
VAIEGYVGRPGSGKSYTLTARVLEEADKGRTVFTNYGVKHPNVYLFGPSELLDLPAGLVVIDEAHLWFPARMSLKLPMSWLAGMSQTRKRGWDLLWCAQHPTRIDRAIRDVSDWMWHCSSWIKSGGHPLLFKSQCYEPELFRKPKAAMATRWRPFSSRVAGAYDTFETLTQADHTVQAGDPYAKRGGSMLDGVL